RVSICTCTRTGRHLATFTRRPRSSLYTLSTEPSQVATSAQVSASGQVAASCSCRLRSHQTLLWHHRLGHPSLPRLHGMHSRLLVSGLPGSLPPLPPSPALPCLLCVEWRQRATPHSSLFPPTTAPLQTLHMDMWGPARVIGQSPERYFLLVEDVYMRYTTVFLLRSKGQVVDVLIPWNRSVRLQLRERFAQDLPVLRLHSDEVVSSPPPSCGTFVMGRAFSSHTSADKLSPRATPCVFLGFVPDAPGCQFYHPTSRRVFPSQDVTFDELLLPQPGGAEFEGAETRGAEPGGVETWGAELGGVATGGAEPEGVESGGAEFGGAESGGAEPQGAASSGGSAGASPRLSSQQLCEWFVRRSHLRSGASGAGGTGVAAEACVTRATATTGPGGARTQGTRAAGTGGVEGAGAGVLTESGTTGAGDAGAGGAGVGGPGEGGAGVGGPGVGGAGAGGAAAVDPGGSVRPRPYFVPLLQQVVGTPPSAALTPPLLCPPLEQHLEQHLS
ncbi:unnamed protein product, partial [Closterium sp. NIES-54]